MTFRLFTNIASMGSQKHIYEYVSSSGEHSSPGLHHPALRSPVLLIRFSPSLHHPALRSRVLLIRSIPGLHHPALHSRVLLIRFISGLYHLALRSRVLIIPFRPRRHEEEKSIEELYVENPKLGKKPRQPTGCKLSLC